MTPVPSEFKKYVPSVDVYDSLELVTRHMPIEQPPATVSYIIFGKGSKTYAKNGVYGHVEYEDEDAATVIQNVMDSITEGTVLIKAGTYTVTESIILKSYVRLVGEGWKTVLKPAAGMNSPVITTSNSVDNKYIQISNLTINGSGVSGLGESNHGIVLYRPWMVEVFKVAIREIGGTGIQLQTTPSEEIHMNWIVNNYIDWVGGHGIYISGVSDSLIAHNEIGRCGQPDWPTRTFTGKCGIYLYYASTTKILGNHVHQSGGENILAEESDNVVIENNVSEEASRHNIGIGGSDQCIIKGNLLRNCNLANVEGHHIQLYNASYNLIIGNKMLDNQDVKTSVYAVNEMGTSDYNEIRLNDVRNNPYTINVVGANTIVKHNPGYPTEKGGTATIPAGSTTVTVNHGLVTTPSEVLVTPIGDPGARFWVANITDSSFDIVVASAPATDIDFYWYAEV